MKHRRAVVEIDRGEAQTAEAAAAADPVLRALERRHDRIGRLRALLTDRVRTSFVLVMIPERLVIEETARAVGLLGEAGVDVGGAIVNRVLPEGLKDDFYRSRKAQERSYLDEIDQRFGRLPRVNVLQLPQDVHGLASLTRIAEHLLD